jgi:beta-fructofuranosidase
MPLRLPDHWLWDFWFAQHRDKVHAFYLQAPRSLGDPAARHHNATIGHAVSRDLRTWRVLPDALGPGPPGAFDDLATWTGSVLRHDGLWHLFYTGVSRAEAGAVQRVGLAVSRDLVTWSRRGVISEADPAWYEGEHWRDPWVEWDEGTRRFHMLVTATANDGPPVARGVIGHAWSRDLRAWEAGPPLSRPGEFRQLEVPQLVHLGGAWRILFSATQDDHCAERLRRVGVAAECGTHYLTSESKFGDYALDRDDFLVGDPGGRHYAGRLLRHDGTWVFFAWRQHDERGGFVGELSEPMPVHVGADGSLRVQVPPAVPHA